MHFCLCDIHKQIQNFSLNGKNWMQFISRADCNLLYLALFFSWCYIFVYIRLLARFFLGWWWPWLVCHGSLLFWVAGLRSLRSESVFTIENWDRLITNNTGVIYDSCFLQYCKIDISVYIGPVYIHASENKVLEHLKLNHLDLEPTKHNRVWDE